MRGREGGGREREGKKSEFPPPPPATREKEKRGGGLEKKTSRTVRDPQPVFELRLDRQLLQPPVDLRPPAVHQHRSNADARQQHEVVDNARFQRSVDHRRATVLDDDRLPSEALEVREGLGENGDAVEGGVGLDLEAFFFGGGSVGVWVEKRGKKESERGRKGERGFWRPAFAALRFSKAALFATRCRGQMSPFRHPAFTILMSLLCLL